MFGIKVKTVLLTSYHPELIDNAIQKAIPENADVRNYIFSSHDRHYYCHIIYSEKVDHGFGYYANDVLVTPYCDKECEK